jgi:lipopolysaccharide transport system permease protein
MHAYLGAIWKCRYFWLSLVRMDLRARYRGSMLGIGWSLLQPIAMTVILCVVFRGIFRQPLIFYAPYLFAGLGFWNFFVAVSLQGCHCFFAGESYIRQYPAPMAIYPLRTTLASAFHFGVAILLVVPLGAWHQHCGSADFAPVPLADTLLALLSLLAVFPILLLLGWSLATLFGLANVRFRDTSHLAEVSFQALFYLTPIMYGKNMFADRPNYLRLLDCHPLMPFLNLLREPIVYGRVPSLGTYTAALLIVLCLTGLAMLALKYNERRLIFHL